MRRQQIELLFFALFYHLRFITSISKQGSIDAHTQDWVMGAGELGSALLSSLMGCMVIYSMKKQLRSTPKNTAEGYSLEERLCLYPWALHLTNLPSVIGGALLLASNHDANLYTYQAAITFFFLNRAINLFTHPFLMPNLADKNKTKNDSQIFLETLSNIPFNLSMITSLNLYYFLSPKAAHYLLAVSETVFASVSALPAICCTCVLPFLGRDKSPLVYLNLMVLIPAILSIVGAAYMLRSPTWDSTDHKTGWWLLFTSKVLHPTISGTIFSTLFPTLAEPNTVEPPATARPSAVIRFQPVSRQPVETSAIAPQIPRPPSDPESKPVQNAAAPTADRVKAMQEVQKRLSDAETMLAEIRRENVALQPVSTLRR